MSAESAFGENCGPGITFVSTELFDQGRRREFAFEACGRMKIFGYPAGDDEELGRQAAKDAKEWVERRKILNV